MLDLKVSRPYDKPCDVYLLPLGVILGVQSGNLLVSSLSLPCRLLSTFV